MEKLIFIIIMLILMFTSCRDYNQYQTDNLELRQLVKNTETTKSEHGAFFLLAGSYSSSESIHTKIKMYALVNGAYKYLEYNINSIRIKIDNTIKVPFLTIYYYRHDELNVEKITDNPDWYSSKIVLTTPEYYLPEKLLPINIE